MQNLYNELIELLQQDPALIIDNRLNKALIVDRALKMDTGLISLLLTNEAIKKHFFQSAGNVLIFDKLSFQRFVNSKQFLPDSYTQFKNKIGLSADNENYLSDNREVVLIWAHKDCVLEGGQTKEDAKRNEIFYNEILAPDDVDTLLSPKVLSTWKLIDEKGENLLNKPFTKKDNLVIKGNNLLSLHSLKPVYRGQVKVICIDPPYNKGGDDFNYNDSFNHSTWLTFMKNRLEIAKELLHQNGTMFIFCDDNEQPYLKVLCDEVLKREAYIATIIWRNSDNSNNDAKRFSQDHNYILVYSKNINWQSIKLSRSEEQGKHFKNPDNNPRGPWFDGNPVNSPAPRKNLTYDLTGPNGNAIAPPPNGWRWAPTEMKKKFESGEVRFNEDGTGIIRRTYLWEMKDLPPSTLWSITEENLWFNLKETGHTRQAKFEQKKLFPKYPTSQLFKTPKPERVIRKILQISSRPGDLVLDFFGGSGTTGAVAHKMGRKYIICEQMDYIDTFTIPRLKMVIEGEQGGISKEEEWTGGGSFIYIDLLKCNELFIDRIEKANTSPELLSIWNEMQQSSFISYKVLPSTINTSINEFQQLSLDEQKRFLVEVLDKNLLYVNYTEMNDVSYNVSENDKTMNNNFYSIA